MFLIQLVLHNNFTIFNSRYQKHTLLALSDTDTFVENAREKKLKYTGKK